MTVDLDLNILPLENRHCGRCGSNDFRSLIFIPHRQKAQCADCGYRSGSMYCGRIVSFSIGPENDEKLLHCGDWRVCESADDQSQSSIPLAVCLGCKRLVAAQ